MLTEYIDEALRRTRYELIEDEEPPLLKGGAGAAGRVGVRPDVGRLPAEAEGGRRRLDTRQRETIARPSATGQRRDHGEGEREANETHTRNIGRRGNPLGMLARTGSHCSNRNRQR